jgi:hypothetical protein
MRLAGPSPDEPGEADAVTQGGAVALELPSIYWPRPAPLRARCADRWRPTPRAPSPAGRASPAPARSAATASDSRPGSLEFAVTSSPPLLHGVYRSPSSFAALYRPSSLGATALAFYCWRLLHWRLREFRQLGRILARIYSTRWRAARLPPPGAGAWSRASPRCAASQRRRSSPRALPRPFRRRSRTTARAAFSWLYRLAASEQQPPLAHRCPAAHAISLPNRRPRHPQNAPWRAQRRDGRPGNDVDLPP